MKDIVHTKAGGEIRCYLMTEGESHKVVYAKDIPRRFFFIAYALLAHESGDTHSLDMVILHPFKAHLKNIIYWSFPRESAY